MDIKRIQRCGDELLMDKMTYEKIIRIIENRNMEGKAYTAKDLLIAFGYSPTTYINDTNLKKFITKVRMPGMAIRYRISKEMKK